jgi:hypothetical protein
VYFASKYKSHELPYSLFFWKFLALQRRKEEASGLRCHHGAR